MSEADQQSPLSGQRRRPTFSDADLDRFDQDFEAGLVSAETNRLDVGDLLPDDFAFLDPNGAFDITGLDGKVVVLAYFALF